MRVSPKLVGILTPSSTLSYNYSQSVFRGAVLFVSMIYQVGLVFHCAEGFANLVEQRVRSCTPDGKHLGQVHNRFFLGLGQHECY
jgi:hypothetical protein